MSENIKGAFESLEWHDAVLLGVVVDRENPGERDEVVLRLRWPDGNVQSIRFMDCYGLEASMNFGVLAPETIRDAECLVDFPPLYELQRKWSVLKVDLSDLCAFEVTTNSTASVLRVYARRFEVL